MPTRKLKTVSLKWKDLDQVERMRLKGQKLMMEEHYAVDSIRPKCLELQRMCEQYKELLRKRREMLTKSHDLHDRLERANKWCSTGVDLLASQPIDRLQTSQGAHLALKDIESFLKTSRELKLSNPKEFRQLFESMMTTETRGTVQQVLKRMEDVQGMCAKRQESLMHIMDPSAKPGRGGASEPSSARDQRHTHHPKSEVSRSQKDVTDGQGHQRTTSDGRSLEKSARQNRPDGPLNNQAKLASSTGQLPNKGNDSSIDLPSPPTQSISRSTSDVSSSSTSDTHQSSMSGSSVSEAEGKRRHVMNELIETEETYVNELSQIIQGYYNKMNDRTLQMMIPPALLGQKHILFGNLPQIYDFHKDMFLQELKDCRDFPSRVGKCFVNRKEEFQMYSIYCQNKPKCEALRVTVGDSNAFFKECQKHLGHKLPLGAYLLKPIQRITKYQLLLKEMLRYTQDNPDLTAALKEALDTMLSVLAYLNDSMHQVSINGYNENLSDLGRLLMHGSFRVWTEHKHDRIRDLRLRPMQRHVFLYQKAMLFCKKKDEHQGHNDHPSYTFKNKLNLSQVGLTEKVKSEKKKFELWLRGREEVYIIQAPDLQTKEVWVKAVKQVLLSQFDHLKAAQKVGSQPALGETTPVYQMSSDSSDYSLDNWKASDNDKHSTVPVGLGMCSPLVTPTSPPYVDVRRGDVEDDGEDDGEENYDGGWSSGEFSNTDDELAEQYIPKLEPSFREHFISLGDYYMVDPTELGLREGDEVEVLRVGTNGWWYARHLRTDQEGWVPSTYLEPVSRAQTYSSSDSLCVAGARGEMTRSGSGSPYMHNSSRSSPVPETTV